MDKVKKVYVDSRYRTNDSESNNDFKFELNQSAMLMTFQFRMHGEQLNLIITSFI